VVGETVLVPTPSRTVVALARVAKIEKLERTSAIHVVNVARFLDCEVTRRKERGDVFIELGARRVWRETCVKESPKEAP
jgi:hypothetical protein